MPTETTPEACYICHFVKPLTIAVCEDCLALLPPHCPAGDPEFLPSLRDGVYPGLHGHFVVLDGKTLAGPFSATDWFSDRDDAVRFYARHVRRPYSCG